MTPLTRKIKNLSTPQRLAARRRLFLRSLIPVILFLTVLIIYVCTSINTTSETRIGVVFPETGIRSRFGTAIKRGIEMAVSDVNRIPGRKRRIVCVFADDKSNPVSAGKAAVWLIREKKVTAIIGSYSNLCTLAVAEVAEKMKVPHISPISSGREISTRGYVWVFRLNAPEAHYACAMMDFLQYRALVRRVALLHENDNAGQGFADAVKKYALDLNVDLVYAKAFPNKNKDFTSLLKEASNHHPQVFLVNAHIEDAVHLMKAAHQMNILPQRFAGLGSGFSLPDFITQGSSTVEHTFSTVQWNPHVSWPGAYSFAERFKKNYGIYPDHHSAAPYAAMQVIAACSAGKRAPDRKGLYRALKEVDTESIFGHIRFEDFEEYTNQNAHPLLVQQIQNGRHVIVWPLGLKHAEPIF